MATGFNNTPPASEFRAHSNYGRSRQPRNVTGTQNGAITVNTAYPTQNQRFLLVYNSTELAAGVIQVWSHAMQNWVSANTGALEANTMHIIEIAGHDRVQCTNLNGGTVKLACTTF